MSTTTLVSGFSFLILMTFFIFSATWYLLALSRKDKWKVVCWHCKVEFNAALKNCPQCGTVREKPYRCSCGHLHPPGEKPCDVNVAGYYK